MSLSTFNSSTPLLPAHHSQQRYVEGPQIQQLPGGGGLASEQIEGQVSAPYQPLNNVAQELEEGGRLDQLNPLQERRRRIKYCAICVFASAAVLAVSLVGNLAGHCNEERIEGSLLCRVSGYGILGAGVTGLASALAVLVQHLPL